MKAGLLNKTIKIYQPVISQNEYGEREQVYEYFYQTRARVSPVTGQRTVEAYEVQWPYMRQMIVRRYVPVTEKCRIEYKGVMYRILSIQENDEYNNLELMVEVINK